MTCMHSIVQIHGFADLVQGVIFTDAQCPAFASNTNYVSFKMILLWQSLSDSVLPNRYILLCMEIPPCLVGSTILWAMDFKKPLSGCVHWPSMCLHASRFNSVSHGAGKSQASAYSGSWAIGGTKMTEANTTRPTRGTLARYFLPASHSNCVSVAISEDKSCEAGWSAWDVDANLKLWFLHEIAEELLKLNTSHHCSGVLPFCSASPILFLLCPWSGPSPRAGLLSLYLSRTLDSKARCLRLCHYLF